MNAGYFPIEGGRLVAYDLAAGRQLWLVESETLWPPVATDRQVFVASPDAIVARSADDGKEAWRLPIAERLAVGPVADSRWLVAATVSGTVLAVRVEDGGIAWQADAGARISAPPTLTSDRVYVPLEDRRVLALDAEDGAVVWERRLGGAPTGILAHDDRVYVGAVDNFLYRLNAGRGDVAWRWRTGADVIGTPVVAGDRLYFVALDNILRSLDRHGGSQKWKRALPLRPRSGPLVAGTTVVVGGLAPSVRAYATATGAPAGELSFKTDLAAPPHVFLQWRRSGARRDHDRYRRRRDGHRVHSRGRASDAVRSAAQSACGSRPDFSLSSSRTAPASRATAVSMRSGVCSENESLARSRCIGST